MAELLKSTLLGLVQGLTEFLPVSSSAHLIIVQKLLGMTGEQLFLDVVVHAGTAVSLVAFFRAEIAAILRSCWRGLACLLPAGGGARCAWSNEDGFRVVALILLSAVPAGVAGLLFESFFERLYSSLVLAEETLLVTGAMLFATRWLRPGERAFCHIRVRDAVVAGVAQAIAIVPGISRSASTLSTLLASGVARDASFRFAFLMSVPPVVGATVLEARKLSGVSSAELGGAAVAFVVAAVSGYGALALLRRFVDRGKLVPFAYYCWVVGVAGLILFRVVR